MEPVVVTAVFTPVDGARERLIEALTAAIPAVHAEPGCLLYALHDADDGTVVFVEKWASRELLAAHAAGEPVRALKASIAGLAVGPAVVTSMTALPVGDGQGAL